MMSNFVQLGSGYSPACHEMDSHDAGSSGNSGPGSIEDGERCFLALLLEWASRESGRPRLTELGGLLFSDDREQERDISQPEASWARSKHRGVSEEPRREELLDDRRGVSPVRCAVILTAARRPWRFSMAWMSSRMACFSDSS